MGGLIAADDAGITVSVGSSAGAINPAALRAKSSLDTRALLHLPGIRGRHALSPRGCAAK
jgi:hypothetical protein